MARQVFIQDWSINCALGGERRQVSDALFSETLPSLRPMRLNDGREVPVAALDLPSPDDNPENAHSRSNRLLATCFDSLRGDTLAALRDQADARLGIVVGTSVGGIREAAAAFRRQHEDGRWPADFDLSVQELYDSARYLKHRVGGAAYAYTISTACTSGAKAIAAGARMIRTGLCERVLCGGGDVLSALTLNGFGALEALSPERCNPFSLNRSGITLGEGAALLVLGAEESPVRLSGWGESSDAYHVSAPDPSGRGALKAMRDALSGAALAPEDIGYVNLHGTATRQNDAMEAGALAALFPHGVDCSSTKPLTGHTLAAAGACEAVLSLETVLAGRTAGHCYDGIDDPALAPISLIPTGGRTLDRPHVLSCSYAFGGSNVVLAFSRA